MKTRGQNLMGGLTGDLPGKLIADSSSVFRSIDALSNYRTELTRLFNAVEIGSPVFKKLEAEIKKVDAQLSKPKKAPNITRGIGGLVGREQALKEAIRLQDQLDSSAVGYKDAVLGVRKAQEAYNRELAQSIRQQRFVNAGVIAQKAALSSIINIGKSIPKGLIDLFGGRFGKAGQIAGAAGIVGVSRGIEDLIQKVPLLSQKWKDNIERVSKWVRVSTEGIASITLAYSGLSTVLGGAQWVIGAVRGFAEFESAAARVIWSVEGNITRAFSAFGRLSRELPQLAQAIAMTMPQALGGLGVGGSWQDYMAEGSQAGKIADALGGGAGRGEERRYTRQGPTQLQNAQQDLTRINQMLEQRNTTEKDYVALLKKQQDAKARISSLENEIRQKQVEAGTPVEEVYKKEINAADAAIKEIDKLRNRSVQNAIDANDQINKEDKDAFLRRYKEEETAAKKLANEKKKQEADLRRDRLKNIRDAQNAEEQRQRRMGRLRENLMLGAGFPMLFGGGLGAVAGGTLGAVSQTFMGSEGGFGSQILLSALGQRIDEFVSKTAQLGQAFNKINPDVDAVIASLGETNTAYGKHIEMVKEIKGEEAAMTVARERLMRIVGADGVQAFEQFGEETQQLGNEWTKVVTNLQAGIAGLINSSGILKNLIDMIGKKPLVERAFESVQKGTASEETKSLVERMQAAGTGLGPLKGMIFKNADRLEDLQDLVAESQIKDEAAALNAPLFTSASALDANIEEQIRHLERSLSLGTKRAEREKEIDEYFRSQGKNLETITQKQRDDVAVQLEKRDSLKEQLEVWGQIKDVIAGGLTNAITGLIDGTKSLGEALGGILKQIGQILMQKALTSMLGNISFGGGGVTTGSVSDLPKVATAAQGAYFMNGIKPFSAGGITTKPTLGLIGEAGESEYIIPASKMASSMQRYSAGARGEAVIPSTGSSYAGGGGSSTTVNYSGPILNFNSEEFVPKSAVGQIIATATARGASVGESRTISSLRNSRSRRSSLGL
jgi:DNA anti-recombination protein RmuC